MNGKVLEFKRKETETANECKAKTISIKDLFVKALPNSEDSFEDWLKCWEQYNNINEQKYSIFALINTVRMQEGYDYSLGSNIGYADFIINNNKSVTIFDV